jgi:hypothetical protein
MLKISAQLEQLAVLVVKGLMMWTGEGKNSQCSEGGGQEKSRCGARAVISWINNKDCCSNDDGSVDLRDDRSLKLF